MKILNLLSYCSVRVANASPGAVNSQVEVNTERFFLFLWCSLVLFGMGQVGMSNIYAIMGTVAIAVLLYYWVSSSAKLFEVTQDLEEQYQQLSKTQRTIYAIVGFLLPIVGFLILFVVAVLSINGVAA